VVTERELRRFRYPWGLMQKQLRNEDSERDKHFFETDAELRESIADHLPD
jgi:hypothetical protein